MPRFYKTYIIILLLLLNSNCYSENKIKWSDLSVNFKHGNLKVSRSGRFLEYADGTPFLYLGDTAWELLARLNENEVKLYFENRRSKGFTVIQTVIMDELEGKTPDKIYFNWIDTVLSLAAEKGLYIGLLPTWGDKVDKKWGKGPEIFNPQNAYLYGTFLGKRYAQIPNIIWIIGGDRGGDGKNFEIWNALANGIKDYDKNHLMTFHPQGEHSSSFWFHNQSWLDFNMFQSGHAQDNFAIYRKLLIPDRDKLPTKPVMDGEPRYENIPKDFDPNNKRFDAADVRISLYQSMLSGACGYTYGCNDVWQMYNYTRVPVLFANTPWIEALNFPGAMQMIHFRKLFDSINWFDGEPAQNLILSPKQTDDDYSLAFQGKDFLIIYLPYGHPIKILIPEWKMNSNFSWVNPQTGKYIKSKFNKDKNNSTILFPPSQGRDNDWIALFKN